MGVGRGLGGGVGWGGWVGGLGGGLVGGWGGMSEVQKKYLCQRKSCEKKSCMPSRPKKDSYTGLKKIMQGKY